MAKRRMFNTDIVQSDAFVDMPSSSQALYLHLNMCADDDGFIGRPKQIARMVGSNDDDLKLLIAKRFILSFDNGVLVVKHWLNHNLIRADMYKETQYKNEKSMLGLNENGSYTELRDDVAELKKIEEPRWLKRRKDNAVTDDGTQTVHKRTDNGTLGKVRLGKVRLDKVNKKAESLLLEVIEIVNPREKTTANRIKLINRRLKENSESEILQAAQRFSKSKWHIENKQMSIDNLIRDSKFDKWLTEASNKKITSLDKLIMEKEKQNALAK